MKSTFKETFSTVFSKTTMMIWIISTLGASLAGPFGTYEELSFEERFLYWLAVSTTSVLLGYLAYAITRTVFGFEETTPSRMMAGTLGTLFITTDIYLISAWVSQYRAFETPFLSLLGWVGFVFFSVIAARSVLQSAIEESAKSDATASSVGVNAEAELPRIVERLPHADHIRVKRMSANDHFVHIKTEAGEFPVRMRFRDAVAEVEGVKGVLVHRSHWVARASIRAVVKENGKMFVILTCHERVPVSRNYREDVEALGINVLTSVEGERSVASAR